MAGKPDQPEHRLSHNVMMLFDRIILEPCWHTAVDHGDWMHNSSPQARMLHERRKRARGIKPGHLDYYVYQFPNFGQLELKYGKGKTSDDQDVTIRLLQDRKIGAGVAWTVMQAFEWARASGFRLHGNAENIANEIELKWRAAQAGADLKNPKPKAAAQPRQAKATPTQIKRLNGVRALATKLGVRF